jgi:hypothetical protein
MMRHCWQRDDEVTTKRKIEMELPKPTSAHPANDEKKRGWLIFLLVAVVLLCVSVIAVINHYLSDQHVRKFASDTARILKERICPSGYSRAQACGKKDVRFEADSGLIAYLYVFGVQGASEIQELSEVVKNIRRESPFYKRTPVKIIFYADLQKSSVLKELFIIFEG